MPSPAQIQRTVHLVLGDTEGNFGPLIDANLSLCTYTHQMSRVNSQSPPEATGDQGLKQFFLVNSKHNTDERKRLHYSQRKSSKRGILHRSFLCVIWQIQKAEKKNKDPERKCQTHALKC